MVVHKFVDIGQWHQETWFCMFNRLAQFPGLAVLRLRGGIVICPEFFRGIINTTSHPFPSLVELEVHFAHETADGRWFYERDDEALESSRADPQWKEWWEEEDESSDEDAGRSSLDSERDVRVFEDGPYRTGLVRQERYRSRPSATTFLPFLMDASKAVQRLPKLQKFILKLGNHNASYKWLDYFPIVSRVFELWFLKMGMRRAPLKDADVLDPNVHADANYVSQNRLYWRVDRWIPWDEVQAAWLAVVGPDAKIVWLEEKHWVGRAGYERYVGDF
ncbi:hypothetical protein NX059_008672 [Plenodomus lindquistii]|nr:hypothetical protein NX059_008672 [Plenodomus lindquistii]